MNEEERQQHSQEVEEEIIATGIVGLGPADLDDVPAVELPEVRDVPKGISVLVVEKGPHAGVEFYLNPNEQTEYSVGRAPESDIFLDDITVSRQHAMLRFQDSSWALRDVGSLNGTYVNRDRIDATVILKQEDEVQLGKYRFGFVAAQRNA